MRLIYWFAYLCGYVQENWMCGVEEGARAAARWRIRER